MFDACCVQCILEDSKRCSSFVLVLLAKPGQNKFRCSIQCKTICEVSEVIFFVLDSLSSILQDKKAEIKRFPALFPASHCYISCQPLQRDLFQLELASVSEMQIFRQSFGILRWLFICMEIHPAAWKPATLCGCQEELCFFILLFIFFRNFKLILIGEPPCKQSFHRCHSPRDSYCH